MAVTRISSMPAASALSGAELVEVSQLSDTVTISAATISAAAADNSYNDSGEGFVAAGFAVGDRVNVAGFTGNVANNIFVGAITALTTGKMTIGGTDGDVIADDAAGETVVITKWTSRRTTVAAVAAEAAAGTGAAVITESGTAADLDPADVGKYQRWANASPMTLTVRDEADVALPDDGEWHIRNVGTADLTLVEDTAVTINPPNGGTLVVPQGGTVTLKRVAEDEFDLLGQTVAA